MRRWKRSVLWSLAAGLLASGLAAEEHTFVGSSGRDKQVLEDLRAALEAAPEEEREALETQISTTSSCPGSAVAVGRSRSR